MTTPIRMLAIDLAKGSFQLCAIGLDGAVLYNRVLSRTRLAALLAEQQSCIVAMEACATSHYWGRVAQFHGHEVPGAGGVWEADCQTPEKRQSGR